MTPQQLIDKYYPAGSPLRDIYMRHCEAVAAEALAIARRTDMGLNPDTIYNAAMLHDIGIFATHAPSIHCHGSEPYIRHGIIGAGLIRSEGLDETYARVAERHTGAGLTAREIEEQHLPLPHRDFLPETPLEQLICYADKFYSKSGDMQRKPFARVLKGMERFGPDTLSRFLDLAHRFNE